MSPMAPVENHGRAAVMFEDPGDLRGKRSAVGIGVVDALGQPKSTEAAGRSK